MLISSEKAVVLNHPNNVNSREKGAHPYTLTSDVRRQTFPPSFEATGYQRDSLGWPVHPCADELFKLGAVTGPGWYWDMGPQFAGDPILLRMVKGANGKAGDFLQFLAIERGDTGRWALPGGMQDKNEPHLSIAARELFEETRVMYRDLPKTLIYQGIVADPRATVNAWPETTVELMFANDEISTLLVRPGDDAKKVAWMDLNQRSLDVLFASHGDFVRRAVQLLQFHTNLVVDKNGRLGLRK
jgi:ADP-ribose pyrophosphatase YjhB (NUDIX family)